jgi:hypothetical protein
MVKEKLGLNTMSRCFHVGLEDSANAALRDALTHRFMTLEE